MVTYSSQSGGVWPDFERGNRKREGGFNYILVSGSISFPHHGDYRC
jgi:hypothetical protein